MNRFPMVCLCSSSVRFPQTYQSKRGLSNATDAVFQTKPFKIHKLENVPFTRSTVTKDEAIEMYKNFTTLRNLDHAIDTLNKDTLLRGYCHQYNGHDAVAVGMKAAMRPIDSMTTGYDLQRCMYSMGNSLTPLIYDILEEKSRQRWKSEESKQIYISNNYRGKVVGTAQFVIGAGIAHTSKYKGDGSVCFTIIEDKTLNQEELSRAFNMAKLSDLPWVFVCENNKRDPINRPDRMPVIWVDALDILATREATKFAMDYITEGKGPLVLEINCFGLSSDVKTHKAKDYQDANTTDPLILFQNQILRAGLVKTEELKTIDAELDDDIKKAIAAATTKAPNVSPLNDLTGTYSNSLDFLEMYPIVISDEETSYDDNSSDEDEEESDRYDGLMEVNAYAELHEITTDSV